MLDDRRKLILLVEDEAIIAMGEKAILEEYGYAARIVFNGEAAVKAVAATPEIDLILMDINLGAGIDGTEAAALILKDYDLPVVFLSSHMEPEIVEKTEKITSYGYVVKDSSGTVLDASIKMAFKLFEAKVDTRRKTEALRESEERYRAIFDHSPDAILLTDPSTGGILEANASAERMFGWTSQELSELGRGAILDASDPRLAPAFEERARTGSFFGELTFVRKDGTKFPAEASSVIFCDREGRARTSMVIRDISERKRVEEELRKRNRYIESILDNMPIGFAANTIDDGVARYLNDRFASIYGWPREILTDVDKFFANAYPGPEGEELKARVMGDIQSGDPSRMAWDDLKITTSTGDHRYISARNIPILDQNLMVSTVWDVTAFHEAREKLRETEALYRLLLDESPDGIVVLDPGTMRILEFNDTAHRQLGYSREEFTGLSVADIEAVEGPEEIRVHIDRIIREGAGEFITRHRTKGGGVRDVLVRARYSRMSHRPVYHCIWRDITETGRGK